MNVPYAVVIICVVSLFGLSLATDNGKPIQKRILKLKNVNYNKTNGKPKTTKKPHQKNKTIFVLSNPVIYPQKIVSPKPTESVIRKPAKVIRKPENVILKLTNQFDFLNFDAYILKPRNINYTALLNPNTNEPTKESFLPEPTINYPQNEFLDFARAEPLIQTTVAPTVPEPLSYETTSQRAKKLEIKPDPETTTASANSIYPLGLAYFDSLRKYRKAFDSLRKRERTKKPRIKATTTTTTITTPTTTFPPTTTTETEEPFIDTTTTKDYVYAVTPNFDEDLYEEPHFESYRYKPRYHHNYDDEDDDERERYESTTRYTDYETLDRDDDHYETTEAITTTTRLPNSRRRKPRHKNIHSSNVKSNYLYDRYTNYPQGEESRRVVAVAKLDNYKDKRNVRPNGQAPNNRRTGGRDDTKGTERTGQEEKKPRNSMPMQRHYFQYVNAINDGAYNAGVGKGNQNHYIEQHEISVPKNGTFQKRVRWNDKRGGFGELYYDLNHH